MTANPIFKVAEGAASGRCAQCGIRKKAVCAYCSTPELILLDSMKTYKEYGPGDEIIAAGEASTHVGTIVEGVVSLSKTMIDGRRQMVGLLFPSDFIGRPFRATAPFDAVAVTHVRLCRFKRKSFESLCEESAPLERRLLEMTLDELDAAREWMLLLGRKSAREKLASFLVILARRANGLAEETPENRVNVALALTREQMSEYLGLTIETVSRQFSQLKREGVISLTSAREVAILDFARLLDASGDESDGGALH